MIYEPNLAGLNQKREAVPPLPVASGVATGSKKTPTPPTRNFNKDVIDFLAECMASARYQHNLNAYACMDSSGTLEPFLWSAGACYFGLHANIDREHDVVCLFLNPAGVGKEGYNSGYGLAITLEQGVAWLDFLANESAYANAFISKDATRMWDERVAYFYSDQPANYVVGAMVQVRQAWEYCRIVHTFTFLEKRLPNISKNFILYLSHIFEVDESNGSTVFNTLSSGHVALSAKGMTLGTVKNFVNGVVTQPRGPLNSSANYQGITSIWNHPYCPARTPYAEIVLDLLQKQGGLGRLDVPIFSFNHTFYPTKDALEGRSFELAKSLSLFNDLFMKEFK